MESDSNANELDTKPPTNSITVNNSVMIGDAHSVFLELLNFLMIDMMKIFYTVYRIRLFPCS